MKDFPEKTGHFVIVNKVTKDDDGSSVYWEMDQGWGDIGSATSFGDTNVNLPLDGAWEDEDDAWSRQNEINNGCCECGELGHSCEDCAVFNGPEKGDSNAI